jgi:hypothetical protein
MYVVDFATKAPYLKPFVTQLETGLLLHAGHQGKAIRSCHVASSPLFVRTNSPACSLHLFSTCIHTEVVVDHSK